MNVFQLVHDSLSQRITDSIELRNCFDSKFELPHWPAVALEGFRKQTSSTYPVHMLQGPERNNRSSVSASQHLSRAVLWTASEHDQDHEHASDRHIRLPTVSADAAVSSSHTIESAANVRSVNGMFLSPPSPGAVREPRLYFCQGQSAKHVEVGFIARLTERAHVTGHSRIDKPCSSPPLDDAVVSHYPDSKPRHLLACHWPSAAKRTRPKSTFRLRMMFRTL
ncbi:uncharacterized protein UDID_19090 [Ustilago sp. UG-2017a]|nr:uncharacterized protein UDID_19090 [Ustilago sp. UG-2017a]